MSSDILPHSLVFPLILPQLLAAIYAILPCTHSDLYVQSVSLPDRPLEVEALEVKMIRTCVVGRLVLFVSRGVHRFSRGCATQSVPVALMTAACFQRGVSRAALLSRLRVYR